VLIPELQDSIDDFVGVLRSPDLILVPAVLAKELDPVRTTIRLDVCHESSSPNAVVAVATGDGTGFPVLHLLLVLTAGIAVAGIVMHPLLRAVPASRVLVLLLVAGAAAELDGLVGLGPRSRTIRAVAAVAVLKANGT
jgi:hypothetical protein